MGEVIKKNGRREKFNPNKIRRSIKGACMDIVEPLSRKLIKQFRGKKVVKSSAIRKKALRLLGREAKAAAAAWRKFDSR